MVLEDDVFCGPSCVFTNVINPRSAISRKKEFKKTIVRRGATIGANATILCGIEIGRFAFIGAGAVVTSDIPNHALVYGNPAKQNGWMCECGHKLDSNHHCTHCKKVYNFLSLPYFKHYFTNLEQVILNGTQYNDSVVGRNMHTIRTDKVMKVENLYKDKIPQRFIKEYGHITF